MKFEKRNLYRYPGISVMFVHLRFNRWGEILKLPEPGQEMPVANDFWHKAVAAQDELNYDEPTGWYYPVRESLGAALLRDGVEDTRKQ